MVTKILMSKEYWDAYIDYMFCGTFSLDITPIVETYKEKWDNYFKTH